VRRYCPYTRVSVSGFQSTHPSGVRPVSGLDSKVTGLISIHAPQWGATASCSNVPTIWRNFNPRTPVGCDDITALRDAQRLWISIHAPQWGATLLGVVIVLYVIISIHAPQWGATSSLGTASRCTL